MFTLVDRRRYKKTIFFYIGFTLFCIVFYLVYNQFSHGVSSSRLTFAWVYPFMLGVLVYSVMLFVPTYNHLSFDMYNSAILTLTFGSIIEGVVFIAGADSNYHQWFYYVAYGLFGLSFIVGIVSLFLHKGDKEE